MKAIILAAGKGVRMRPLSKKIPKPMLRIHGIPILEHLVNILPKEITEVIFVVGYKKELVESHFGKSFKGKKINFAYISPIYGNWKSFKKAKKFIKPGEKFLLLCGDDMNSKESLQEMVKLGEEAVLAYKHAEPWRFGVLFKNSKNYLTDLKEKPKYPSSNLISTGIFILDEEIFNEKDPEKVSGEYRITEVIKEYLKRKKIKVMKSKGWQPIGSPEEFVSAHHSKLFDY